MKKSTALLFIFISFSCFSIIAQNITEIEKVRKQDFINDHYKKREVKFLISNRKNPLIKYNPVSMAFGSLLFFYQKVLSHQFSTNCGYEISCSHFSKHVIQDYGIVKGLALSADRLMRCTQFTAIDIEISDFNENQKLIDNPDSYRLKN